jgi:hypothetical protein
MTYGPNVITSGTPSADTEYGTGYEAIKACDGNESTRWSSSQGGFPHWWKYDLGAGVTKTVIKLSILKYGDAAGCPLKDFTLQGSNNNSDWTTIYTGQAANVTSPTWEDFTFSNNTAYRYYKINCTSSWYTGGGWTTAISFLEVQAFESANDKTIAARGLNLPR